MANEAQVVVAGYIATEPTLGMTRSGVPTLQMRLAWTPRRLDRATGGWTDEASCFATLKAYRKVAANGAVCLRKGQPVIVTGTLRIRDYDGKDGSRRTAIDITANSIGHDLARGVAQFSKLRPETELTAAERQALNQQGEARETADSWPAAADPADEMFDEAEEAEVAEEAEEVGEPGESEEIPDEKLAKSGRRS
ncbi:MAG TPA: single-stranded DNA-binding protein [Streptosporangiaceae bacterium]|nr:single-stranded DNA-binding protein [Streptosporangiaceae bacterium]